MGSTEVVIYAEISLLDRCSCIERQTAAHFILQTRCRQDRVEQPLRCNSPPDSSGRDHWISAFDVNANPENELQIRAVNVCAANQKRQIEIVPIQMAQSRIIQPWLALRSDDDGIRELHV